MALLALACLADAAAFPPQDDPGPAAAGKPFSFAVAADPHSAVDSFRDVMREIRELPERDPKQLPSRFLLVTGDIQALEKMYAAYQDVFKGSPSMKAFLPMSGDHTTAPLRAFMSGRILSELPRARVPDPEVISYTYDWRNVRIIVADPNHPMHGASRFLNEKGCQWVEEMIQSAPPEIEHIFIGIHEPPFPRVRHVSEMSEPKKPIRDAFWNMLLRYRSRVRAVFPGHTHYLDKMRVARPGGAAANDRKQYPDEEGGIWQVGAGASGARKDFFSFLRVVVDGRSVRVAAYAREGKETAFKIIDEWSLTDAAAAPDK